VTVADLDAEFDISFVEGGRTPLTDAAMQQNLVALLKPYSDLWQASQTPGPMAPFAKAYMQVIAERFELPKDLYPDELEARGVPPAQPQPGQPEPAGGEASPPPQEGAPAIPPEMQQVLAQLLDKSPQDAIAVLRKLFARSPQMLETLDQIAQLPPDQQAAMVEHMVTGLLQASGSGAGSTTNGSAAPAQEPSPEEVV
jgi:hypothetical protein